MDLPLELRYKIYAHALAAGIMALLRTSKTMHDEAKPYLYKFAFLRLEILWAWKKRPRQLSLRTTRCTTPILDQVQNIRLDVHCGYPDSDHNPGIGLLRAFLNNTSSISRKTCAITLRDLGPHRGMLRRIMAVVERLTNFEYVFVTVKDVEVPRPKGQVRFISKSLFAEDEDLYEVIEGLLLDSLGVPIWHEDRGIGGEYLAFHPRDEKDVMSAG